jgi:hypothetical protein
VSAANAGVARLKVAGLEVEFQSADPRPLELLQATIDLSPGFTSSGAASPDLTVTLRATGSLSYRAISAERGVAELSLGPGALGGHLSAICRAALSHALGNRGGALIHGAAAVIDGRAVLLVAPSEGGKTTICGLLAREGIPVLSDETIALRPRSLGESFDAHGTFFWSGPVLQTLEGGWPVQAIGLLEKGALGAQPISPAAALGRFLPEWHVDHDEPSAERALATAAKMLESTHAYRLCFRPDDPPGVLRELLRSWGRA